MRMKCQQHPSRRPSGLRKTMTRPNSTVHNTAWIRRKGKEVGGQAVLGGQHLATTPWLTERHGYDPT